MKSGLMLSTALIILSFATVARSYDDKKEKKVRAEMNGTWVPTAAELDGEKLPENTRRSSSL